MCLLGSRNCPSVNNPASRKEWQLLLNNDMQTSYCWMCLSGCADNSPGDGRPRRQLPHGDTHTSNCPRVGTGYVGKGKLCSCGARKPDKKFWGRNVDLGLVSSGFARANQTQVNICSPQNFLRTMITRTNRWSY